MGTLFMIFLTALFATVSASVMLVRLGGWFAIMVTILLILFWLFSASVMIIVSVADLMKKSKKEGTQK